MKFDRKRIIASALLVFTFNLTSTAVLADMGLNQQVLNQVGGQYGANLNNITGANVTTNGNYANITNTETNSLLNWNSLNVAPNQGLNYIMTDGQTSLNKVFGVAPSTFAGSLTAEHGRVVIVNPYGMLFENGSYTNANSLILTTHDANFIDGNLTLDGTNSTNSQGIQIGGIGSSSNAAVMRIADDLNIVTNGIKIDNADILAGDVNLVTADGVTFVASSAIPQITKNTNVNAINYKDGANNDKGSIYINKASVAVKDNKSGRIYLVSKGSNVNSSISVNDSVLDGKIKLDVDKNANLETIGNLDIVDSYVGGGLIAKTADKSLSLVCNKSIEGISTVITLKDYIVSKYGTYTKENVEKFLKDNTTSTIDSVATDLVDNIFNNKSNEPWTVIKPVYNFSSSVNYGGKGAVSISDTTVVGKAVVNGAGVNFNNFSANDIDLTSTDDANVTASRGDANSLTNVTNQYVWTGVVTDKPIYSWQNNTGGKYVVTVDGEEFAWDGSDWKSLTTGDVKKIWIHISEDGKFYSSKIGEFFNLEVVYDTEEQRWENKLLGIPLLYLYDVGNITNPNDPMPSFTPTSAGITVGAYTSYQSGTEHILTGGDFSMGSSSSTNSALPLLTTSSVYDNLGLTAGNANLNGSRFNSIKAAAADINFDDTIANSGSIVANNVNLKNNSILNDISLIASNAVNVNNSTVKGVTSVIDSQSLNSLASSVFDGVSIYADSVSIDNSIMRNSSLETKALVNAIKNSNLDNVSLLTTSGDISISGDDGNTFNNLTTLNSFNDVNLNAIAVADLGVTAKNNVTLTSVNAKDVKMSAKTAKLNSVTSDGNLLVSTTGDINLSNTKVTGNSSLTSSTSGNVSISKSDLKDTSVSGKGKSTIKDSSLGDLNLTSDGDVNISNTNMVDVNVVGKSGASIVDISAKTLNMSNSGDIKIQGAKILNDLNISKAKDVLISNSSSVNVFSAPTIEELGQGKIPKIDYDWNKYSASDFETIISQFGNRYGEGQRISFVGGNVIVSNAENIDVINSAIMGDLIENNYTGETKLITSYVGGGYLPDRNINGKETSVYQSYINDYEPFYPVHDSDIDRNKYGMPLNTVFQRIFNPRSFAASEDDIRARKLVFRYFAKPGNNNSIILMKPFIAE